MKLAKCKFKQNIRVNLFKNFVLKLYYLDVQIFCDKYLKILVTFEIVLILLYICKKNLK